MAQLGGTFDANSVDPSAPRGEVIPAGEYLVQIVKSEMNPTKAGTGQKLDLELEVLDGPMKGRHLWDMLNLVNPSQQAMEIAQRALSAICHAVGVLQVSDSEQLHFKPMIAVVKVKPAEGNYAAKNEIGGYKPAGGAPAARQPSPAPGGSGFQRTAATAPATAQTASATVPPWAKRKAS